MLCHCSTALVHYRCMCDGSDLCMLTGLVSICTMTLDCFVYNCFCYYSLSYRSVKPVPAHLRDKFCSWLSKFGTWIGPNFLNCFLTGFSKSFCVAPEPQTHYTGIKSEYIHRTQLLRVKQSNSNWNAKFWKLWETLKKLRCQGGAGIALLKVQFVLVFHSSSMQSDADSLLTAGIYIESVDF